MAAIIPYFLTGEASWEGPCHEKDSVDAPLFVANEQYEAKPSQIQELANWLENHDISPTYLQLLIGNRNTFISGLHQKRIFADALRAAIEW